MSMRFLWVLALVTAVHGVPLGTARPELVTVDVEDHPNATCITAEAGLEKMLTGKLNPNHYPAQRAAQVVVHYLNTRHGSPYWRLGLHKVHNATAEEVGDSGRKYILKISLQDWISNTKDSCTAEVVFPGGNAEGPPQVTASYEGNLKNTRAEEEALYNQYNTSLNLLSGHDIPDSYGHVDPEMKPFWHLGSVASSFIMLNESREDTLYNMAQVVNVTQLETLNNQLRFNYDVLLHEMVSQEMIHWKLLATWSPEEGVKALQMEKLPQCDHCKPPQNH